MSMNRRALLRFFASSAMTLSFAGLLARSSEAGVPAHRLRGMTMSVCYHGHVFYNMSAQYIISEYVLGTSKAKMDDGYDEEVAVGVPWTGFAVAELGNARRAAA